MTDEAKKTDPFVLTETEEQTRRDMLGGWLRRGDAVSLLINAFEGGSNYWLWSVRPVSMPDGNLYVRLNDDDWWKSDDERFDRMTIEDGLEYLSKRNRRLYYTPFVTGLTAIKLRHDYSESNENDLDRTTILTRDRLDKAATLMLLREPSHAGDVLAVHDDATTADVFLQLAVFGAVLFG